MKNRQKLTDDQLDAVTGGSWESYTMSTPYKCECGCPLREEINHATGTPNLGYFRCTKCGAYYHATNNYTVWKIDRKAKYSSGGC